MVASVDETQIQSCAAEPVSLFQLVAGSDPAGRDDVRQITVVASGRRGPAGRTRDKSLPRNRALLVEPLRADIRRGDP